MEEYSSINSNAKPEFFARELLFFLLFLVLILPAGWIAAQISIALIDDVALALNAVGSKSSVEALLARNFFSEELTRFRWLFEIEQLLRWKLLGTSMPAHHLVVFSYRILTAVLAGFITWTLTNRKSALPVFATVLYGFFFPVVPESRLGAAEPLFSLFLLLSLFMVIRLITNQSGDLKSMPWQERTILVSSIIFLTGSKEPAVILALALTSMIVLGQLANRRFSPISSLIIISIVTWSALRVFLVASHDGYATAQTELSDFNLGWLYFRAKQTFGILIAGPSHTWWLSILLILSYGVSLIVVLGALVNIRTSKNAVAILAVAILTIFMIGLTVNFKYVLRYAQPLIWLSSILIGVGYAQLIRTVYGRISEKVLWLPLILITLANYSAFLWQFTAQQNIRATEASLFKGIESANSAYETLPVFVFGASPNHKPDRVRNVEKAKLLKMYLNGFRPAYLNQPPIETSSVETRLNNDDSEPWLLIGHGDAESIQKELGVSLNLIELSKHTPERRSAETRIYKSIQQASQALGLSNGHERNWKDAGAPAGIFDPNESWYVWLVSPGFEE